MSTGRNVDDGADEPAAPAAGTLKFLLALDDVIGGVSMTHDVYMI